MDRWSLYIDIEGFSKVYPENFTQAVRALVALMEAIFRIGNCVCPETPNRLFAHQIGDGFVIVSEFAERSPELPVAIGAFLLQQVLVAGGMAKCSISQGDFSDISGCYSSVVLDKKDDQGRVPLGRGVMTILPVMGTALINAYRLSQKVPGSLLLVDSQLDVSRIPDGLTVSEGSNGYSVIDWIHADSKELDEIHAKTSIISPSKSDMESRATAHISLNRGTLPEDWVRNTQRFNGLSTD